MQTITRNFILLLSFHVRFESVFCGVLGRHTLATLSLAYSRGAFEQAGEISEETGYALTSRRVRTRATFKTKSEVCVHNQTLRRMVQVCIRNDPLPTTDCVHVCMREY